MTLEEQVLTLTTRYSQSNIHDLLEAVIKKEYMKRITLVSSFGTESALLLALVAEIDPTTPVIFLDTLKHFPETLEYKDKLIHRLHLTDVRNITPEPSALTAADPQGELWRVNPDACCHLRKVLPLAEALAPFAAWITGRKRLHGGEREKLAIIEHDGRHIKINPLAWWSQKDMDAAWKKRNLPEHPMVVFGYTSIGCMPCTAPPLSGGGPRSGRWNGTKTECGIHRPFSHKTFDTGL